MQHLRLARVRRDERVVRRALERARERRVGVAREPYRPSAGDELDEPELLERLELHGRGHDGGAADADLEKVRGLVPPPERGERDAADVVVLEAVVVAQVGERGVDVGDGGLEHGEGDGEVAC